MTRFPHHFIHKSFRVADGCRVPTFQVYEVVKVTELYCHETMLAEFDSLIEAETHLQMMCGFRTASLLAR
jgi:hypothetical protein